MEEVQVEGLSSARHLGGKIYEVRADGIRVIYRILFAPQGERSQVLLTLVALQKKTRKTPPHVIRLASSVYGIGRKEADAGNIKDDIFLSI
jgi:phage-related protein